VAKIVECPHCGHPQRVANRLYFQCEKCGRLARMTPKKNGKAKVA
jgi:tRNA(Ile2) C34 agmatinyltransferase TiaS